MEIRNIYTVDGEIQQNGLLVKSDIHKSYIAECKPENSSGYYFYAFLVANIYNADKDEIFITRLDSILDWVQSPDFRLSKVTADYQFEYYKQVFIDSYDNYKKNEEFGKSLK